MTTVVNIKVDELDRIRGLQSSGIIVDEYMIPKSGDIEIAELFGNGSYYLSDSELERIIYNV